MRDKILDVLKTSPKISFTQIVRSLNIINITGQLDVLKELSTLIKEAVITKTIDCKYSLC